MHACMHAYIHTDIQTYRHTNIQTYRHTYIYIYIHTSIHTSYIIVDFDQCVITTQELGCTSKEAMGISAP